MNEFHHLFGPESVRVLRVVDSATAGYGVSRAEFIDCACQAKKAIDRLSLPGIDHVGMAIMAATLATEMTYTRNLSLSEARQHALYSLLAS